MRTVNGEALPQHQAGRPRPRPRPRCVACECHVAVASAPSTEDAYVTRPVQGPVPMQPEWSLGKAGFTVLSELF